MSDYGDARALGTDRSVDVDISCRILYNERMFPDSSVCLEMRDGKIESGRGLIS